MVTVKKLMRALFIFISIFAATVSHAATVTFDGNTATSISGLEIDGETYDVNFLNEPWIYASEFLFDYSDIQPWYGQCADFYDCLENAGQLSQPTLNAVANVIATLNEANVQFVGPSAAQGSTFFNLPSQNSFEGTIDYVQVDNVDGVWQIQAGGCYSSSGIPISGVQCGYTPVFDDSIVTFSPTMVPIPAAVWLFGSALAGLGWMRRKKTV